MEKHNPGLTNLVIHKMETMTEKAKAARAAYQRKYRQKRPELRAREAKYNRDWRQKNPDKVKQYNADYWQRKAEFDYWKKHV